MTVVLFCRRHQHKKKLVRRARYYEGRPAVDAMYNKTRGAVTDTDHRFLQVSLLGRFHVSHSLCTINRKLLY